MYKGKAAATTAATAITTPFQQQKQFKQQLQQQNHLGNDNTNSKEVIQATIKLESYCG